MTSKSNVLCLKEEDVPKQRELPHDLISMNILTRLPVKSVLRCKLVSKQWYSTLSSCQFGSAHFKLSSLANSPTLSNQIIFIQCSKSFYLFTYNDIDEIERTGSGNRLFTLEHEFDVKGSKLLLIGSCNGLVCLAFLYGFILWNPVTHESKKFDSALNNLLDSSTTRVSWGFGYVSSTDDYKVVRMIEFPLTLEFMVHVFSTKSSRWRKLDPKLYEHVLSLRTSKRELRLNGNWTHSNLIKANRGVLCDERLYWVVSSEVWGRTVVAFDLVHEMFEIVSLSSEEYCGRFLCVMQGCLSNFGGNMRGDAYISMYNRSGEGAESGPNKSIFLFRKLDLESCTDLIDASRNGKFFVLIGCYAAIIGLVDSGSTPKTYTELLNFQEKRELHFTSYAPSLVSPHVGFKAADSK